MVATHRKLKLATKNNRNFGAKHRVRGKTNSTFFKRNSCSNGREELDKRIHNYKRVNIWKLDSITEKR